MIVDVIVEAMVQGSLIEDLPQREQRDILDFRLKIADLNKSDFKEFLNLQSTI